MIRKGQSGKKAKEWKSYITCLGTKHASMTIEYFVFVHETPFHGWKLKMDIDILQGDSFYLNTLETLLSVRMRHIGP